MSEAIRKDPPPPSGAEPPHEWSGRTDVGFEHAPPFPRAVAAAGVLWILAGSLPLLGLAGLAVGAVVYQAQTSYHGAAALASDALGMLCFYSISAACPAGCAVVALLLGVLTIRGTARDTLGNGVASLLIGLLLLGTGVMHLSSGFFHQVMPAGGPDAALVRESMLLLGGVAALIGSLLFTAGVLALTGRGQYKRWRTEQKDRRQS